MNAAILRCLSLMFALMGAYSSIGQTPFVPNDPYFFPNTNSLNYSQWYLNTNGTTASVDINVTGAWARGLTGQGVVIGIIEGSIQYDHPDLTANLELGESWDFFDNSLGVSLPQADDNHGTSVAGMAAARGSNGIGVTGVAPHSRFAVLDGLRVASFSFDDTTAMQRLTDALRFHSVGERRTIPIKNYSIYPLAPFGASLWESIAAMEAAVIESSTVGCIIVMAAGNRREKFGVDIVEPDANKLYGNHLAEALVTTAVGYTGAQTSYGNFGACVACSAPSLDQRDSVGVVGIGVISTDRLGNAGYNTSAPPGQPPDLDYTRFSGTSATAPIVSGVLALAKEAQPNLDTRMAKHLLARTCRIVSPGDASATGGWITNAAGFHFNNNFGFGLIDADALTIQATQFSGVTPLVTNTTGEFSAGNTVIPMNDTNGVSRTCTVTNTGSLEEVQVRLKINFDRPSFTFATYYGEIGVVLVSPGGTRSVLAMPNPVAAEYHRSGFRWPPLDWTYTGNAFWGENPAGQWTLIVSHPYPYQEGTFEFDFPNGYQWDSFELITRSGQLIESSQSLRLINPLVVSNRMMFQLAGPAGRSSLVEASSNLADWIPISTNTLTATPVAIVDTRAGTGLQHFYRARLLPESGLALASASSLRRTITSVQQPAPAPAPTYPPRRSGQPLSQPPPGGGFD